MLFVSDLSNSAKISTNTETVMLSTPKKALSADQVKSLSYRLHLISFKIVQNVTFFHQSVLNFALSDQINVWLIIKWTLDFPHLNFGNDFSMFLRTWAQSSLLLEHTAFYLILNLIHLAFAGTLRQLLSIFLLNKVLFGCSTNFVCQVNGKS